MWGMLGLVIVTSVGISHAGIFLTAHASILLLGRWRYCRRLQVTRPCAVPWWASRATVGAPAAALTQRGEPAPVVVTGQGGGRKWRTFCSTC
jgi:hypothetical protein